MWVCNLRSMMHSKGTAGALEFTTCDTRQKVEMIQVLVCISICIDT